MSGNFQSLRQPIVDDEIVRAHVRARERCGRNGATGFLVADMPSREPIPIGPNGRFYYEAGFDDARGHARLDFQGKRHGSTIRGVFLFQNLDDPSAAAAGRATAACSSRRGASARRASSACASGPSRI